MNDVIIRLEEEKDYRAVEELTRESFWNVYKPGADEHYFVHMMRNHPDFIPELAFVLEKDGKKIIAIGESYYPSFNHTKFPVMPDGDRIGEMKKDLRMMAEAGFNHVRFACATRNFRNFLIKANRRLCQTFTAYVDGCIFKTLHL